MNFLAMIIAVALDRYSAAGVPIRVDDWFVRVQNTVRGFGPTGLAAAIIAVLLPMFVVHVMLVALVPLLFGLVWIVAGVFILLYSLGRTDVEDLQARYRDHCRRDDLEGAWLEVAPELGCLEQPPEEVQSAEQVHTRLQQAFLYESLKSWFGVLFYYLLLGPAGALGYRLCHLLGNIDARETILFYVDWLPVRGMAATFSLVGHLTASADEFWVGFSTPDMPAQEVLYSVAMAATDEDQRVDEEFTGERAASQNSALDALQWRAGVCWIVVISLLVILA